MKVPLTADYERHVARSYELDRVRETSRYRGRKLVEQHRLRLAAEVALDDVLDALEDLMAGGSHTDAQGVLDRYRPEHNDGSVP